MKLYISKNNGCIYWIEDEQLMFAPMPVNDGLIDLEDSGGGMVEWSCIDDIEKPSLLLINTELKS